MFRNLQDSLKSRGLHVLLVSVDEPEADAEVAHMLEAEGFSPPYFVARRPLGPFKRALHPTWPGMIPVTFLFDSSPERRYFWGGPVYDDELFTVVDGFLSGRVIDGEARYELAPGKKMEAPRKP